MNKTCYVYTEVPTKGKYRYWANHVHVYDSIEKVREKLAERLIYHMHGDHVKDYGFDYQIRTDELSTFLVPIEKINEYVNIQLNEEMKVTRREIFLDHMSNVNDHITIIVERTEIR